MMMKNLVKVGTLCLCLSFALQAQSQMQKVTSAILSFEDGNIEKAKEYIDIALLDDNAQAKAKSWLYKGEIYYRILLDGTGKYSKLKSDNMATECYAAFRKVFTCSDPRKSRYFTPAAEGAFNIHFILQSEAFTLVQRKENEKALELAKLAEEANKAAMKFGEDVKGIVWDPTVDYVMGLALKANDDNEGAESRLQKAVDSKIKEVGAYTSLAFLQLEMGKEEEAINTMKMGRDLMPDDQNMLNGELQLYMDLGRPEEKLDDIQKSIDLDPDGARVHILYSLMGTACDKIRTKAEESGDMEAEEKYRLKAVESYKASIEKNPEFFVSNLNLGALFFNHGLSIGKAMDDTEDMALFEKMKVEMLENFAKSRPYLEKAHAIDEKNKMAINALMKLYGGIEEYEKAQEMKDKLDAL